jgi:hypothetical protein
VVSQKSKSHKSTHYHLHHVIAGLPRLIFPSLIFSQALVAELGRRLLACQLLEHAAKLVGELLAVSSCRKSIYNRHLTFSFVSRILLVSTGWPVFLPTICSALSTAYRHVNGIAHDDSIPSPYLVHHILALLWLRGSHCESCHSTLLSDISR